MKIKQIAFMLALLGAPGCAALGTVTQVVTAVVDAMSIVDQVVDWADRHFAASPDSARRAEVDRAVQKVRAALVVAERAAEIGMGREEALADFRTAYAELKKLLQSLPNVEAAALERLGASGERLDDGLELVSKASGERLVVPEPAAPLPE